MHRNSYGALQLEVLRGIVPGWFRFENKRINLTISLL